MMHWGYFGGPGFFTGGGGWMIAFGIGQILLFALLIYAIVKFVKRNEKQPTNSGAIQLLNERYAKGEIDEAEYMQRKEVLRK